jgi:hypothetical protein
VLVEEHVAGCDVCALAAQGALAAGTVVDQWTARAHGQAATRAILADALATAGARVTVAAVRQRLEVWAEQWAGHAEAALRIVLEAPGQAARVIAEAAPDLSPPGAAWQLAAAPAPVPTRGPARRAARRGTPQPIVVTAGGPDGPTARIAVSGDRGEVVVRLDDVPRGTEPPLVLLVPTGPRPSDDQLVPPVPPVPSQADYGLATSAAGQAGGQREPMLGTPEPSPGSDAWIVRFEGLGPGNYLIVFEPLP